MSLKIHPRMIRMGSKKFTDNDLHNSEAITSHSTYEADLITLLEMAGIDSVFVVQDVNDPQQMRVAIEDNTFSKGTLVVSSTSIPLEKVLIQSRIYPGQTFLIVSVTASQK